MYTELVLEVAVSHFGPKKMQGELHVLRSAPVSRNHPQPSGARNFCRNLTEPGSKCPAHHFRDPTLVHPTLEHHQDPLEVRRLNKEISKHPLRTEPPHHMMTPVHVHGSFSCYSHFALLRFVLRLLQSVTPTMSRNRSPGPPGFH